MKIAAKAQRTEKNGRTTEGQSFDFPACRVCVAHTQGGSGRKASCEGATYLVECERWHGAEHTFRFESQRYAAAFAEQNRKSGRTVTIGADGGTFVSTSAGTPTSTAARAEDAAQKPRSSTVQRVLLAIVVAITLVCVVAASRSDPAKSEPRTVLEASTAVTPVMDAGAIAPQDAGHHHHRSKVHR